MANWVQTHIKVNGEKEKVEKVLDSILSIDENEKKIFDIKKIFSMSEEIQKTYIDEINKQKIRQRNGIDNWYNLNIKNWGTKWCNECNNFDKENNIISFQIAWYFPEPILQYLSKFEDVYFQILYADEDSGSNLDIILINNGLITRFNIEKELEIKKRKELTKLIFCYELDQALNLATTFFKKNINK